MGSAPPASGAQLKGCEQQKRHTELRLEDCQHCKGQCPIYVPLTLRCFQGEMSLPQLSPCPLLKTAAAAPHGGPWALGRAVVCWGTSASIPPSCPALSPGGPARPWVWRGRKGRAAWSGPAKMPAEFWRGALLFGGGFGALLPWFCCTL